MGNTTLGSIVLNGDGKAGIADLTAIADNYGRETGSSAPAVPEPGGLALLTPAAIIFLKRRATARGHSHGGR